MLINYSELKFDHIVEFSKDATIFAAARYNHNHMRIFLILNTGSTYTRNGRADSWEELSGADVQRIREMVCAARNTVPVYFINGSQTDSQELTGLQG